jgi:peptidoglycan hydrolase CwlO-like protein
MTIIKTKAIDPVTGLKINEKIFHLNELEQAIVFALQNHEDRITENETKIQSLNKDIELLMRKINELERKQNENTRIYFT